MKSIILSFRIIAIIAFLASPLLVGWLLDNFTGFPIEATLGGIGFLLFFIGFLWNKENAMGFGCFFLIYFLIVIFSGPALMAKLRLASNDVRWTYYSASKSDTLIISGPTKNRVILSIGGKKISARVKGENICLDTGDVLNYRESHEPVNGEEEIIHCRISGSIEGRQVTFYNHYKRFIPPPTDNGGQLNI